MGLVTYRSIIRQPKTGPPMLTREQTLAFFLRRRNRTSALSSQPKDILHYMHNVSAANFDPNSDIARLLHHIAYGAKEDLVEIRKMLAANPRLVLEAGNVMTRSGLLVIRTSPLECALGSGSPEIAAIIHEAFERITDKQGQKVEDAVKVREAIYNRYRPHIEKMLDQKPYDFTPLLDVIKKSLPDDITAALNNTLTHGDLYDALQKFRADFTPGQMRKTGMHFAHNDHCNYATVLHILALFESEFENLRDGDNYDKNRLAGRQLFGIIERNFCSDERFIFARDGFADAIAGRALDRSLEYKYQPGSTFPDTSGDSSHSGLGFENWAGRGCTWGTGWPGRDVRGLVKNLFRAKAAELIKLMQPRPESQPRAEKPSRCVIC